MTYLSAVNNNQQKIGLVTSISIVVSNMVGTGVFTSLGFQVTEIKSVMILLMLWLTGGVIALCGALSYGELASAMPRSGGEYNFLSGIYHPVLGFLAGWVSVLVGFSAPAALAAIAMAKYAGRIIHIQNLSILAIGLIIFLSCIHSYQIKFGGRFQKTVTLLKILVILIFVTAGFTIPHTTGFSMNPMSSDWKQLVSPAYAVSLIFVSYAFSGWNASVYIINEVRKPGKNVPISLISGTLLVTVLYFLLNFIFLYSTPLADLEGNIEIGSISAGHIFGTQGGKIMASIISLLLISSVSAMIWIGPRVSMVMGEDYRIFRFLGKKNRYSVPVRAIWIQALLSIVMILTSTFERVLIYTGFLLNFFTLLSVIGVFILRRKSITPYGGYRMPGYPVTPLIFIALNTWTILYVMLERPVESLIGFLTVISGIIVYRVNKKFLNKNLTKSLSN